MSLVTATIRHVFRCCWRGRFSNPTAATEKGKSLEEEKTEQEQEGDVETMASRAPSAANSSSAVVVALLQGWQAACDVWGSFILTLTRIHSHSHPHSLPHPLPLPHRKGVSFAQGTLVCCQGQV